MKLLLFLSLALLAFTQVTATAVFTSSGILPYPLVDAIYSDLNDTALKDSKRSNVNFTSTSDTATAGATLSKRGRGWPPLCVPISGWSWEGVDSVNFYRLKRKLARRHRDPHVPVRSCSRVACEKGSALFICNDSFKDGWFSAVVISAFANDIWNYCRYNVKPKDSKWVGGQGFDKDGWNVIVRWDNSCRNQIHVG